MNAKKYNLFAYVLACTSLIGAVQYPSVPLICWFWFCYFLPKASLKAAWKQGILKIKNDTRGDEPLCQPLTNQEAF